MIRLAIALLAPPFLSTSCTAPPPPSKIPPQRSGIQRTAGSDFASARIHYGIPILQKSFLWDGNGEVDDTGIGLHWGHFVDDHVALGLVYAVGTMIAGIAAALGGVAVGTKARR